MTPLAQWGADGRVMGPFGPMGPIGCMGALWATDGRVQGGHYGPITVPYGVHRSDGRHWPHGGIMPDKWPPPWGALYGHYTSITHPLIQCTPLYRNCVGFDAV